MTGSLSSASTLANSLGKWLAVAVLVAAFVLASILTMSAVTRRVREFGTLKAIGWNSGRIIRQIMGEALVIGVIGGVGGGGHRLRCGGHRAGGRATADRDGGHRRKRGRPGRRASPGRRPPQRTPSPCT